MTPDEKLTLNILITATREIDFFFFASSLFASQRFTLLKKIDFTSVTKM